MCAQATVCVHMGSVWTHGIVCVRTVDCVCAHRDFVCVHLGSVCVHTGLCLCTRGVCVCTHGIVCVHMGIVCVHTRACAFVCTRVSDEDPGSVVWGLGPGGWADGGGRVLGEEDSGKADPHGETFGLQTLSRLSTALCCLSGGKESEVTWK